MRKEITERLRDRRLGSDARAGRWARTEMRRAQWEFVRRNLAFLTAGAALGAVATAAMAWLAPTEFWSGVAVGAGAVFTVGGLAFTVVMLTGTATWAMGATGEAWTSTELRPLRRHGWKLLDHVYYRYGDVDHVLVGPGGVVVVESKWSADAWAVDAPDSRISNALRQVRDNARDIRLVVPELRHRDGAVRPVVFLWGGTRTGGGRRTEPVRLDDVDVVVGSTAANAWRDDLSTAPAVFSPSEINAIWARLREQAARTDQREAADPPPPSLTWLYWTTVAALLAAMAGVLAVLYTVRWTGAAWSGYLAAMVAVALGVAARRTALLRYPALGWLTGVVVITVVLAGVQLSGWSPR